MTTILALRLRQGHSKDNTTDDCLKIIIKKKSCNKKAIKVPDILVHREQQQGESSDAFFVFLVIINEQEKQFLLPVGTTKHIPDKGSF